MASTVVPPLLVSRRIADTPAGFLPRMFARLLLCLLCLTICAPKAYAQGYSRAAAQVIAKAYAATGGSGWLMLRGWHETGLDGGVRYERWIDPVRYGLREERREGGGLAIHGFNGQADWRVAPDGAMTAVNDHATLAAVRSEAFFSAGAYYFAGRFGAKGDYLGTRAFAGRAYQVVSVTPWNGEMRELWFDARTHLLGRIVSRQGGRTTAIAVSDYRKVGPVHVAFRYAPEGAIGGRERRIEALAFTLADRGLFSLDRPAALAKVRQAAP